MDNKKPVVPHELQSLKYNDTTWLDVESPSHQVLTQLEESYHLHPVHLHESMQRIQHIEVEHEDNYLFLVLHVPVYEPKTDKILVNQVGVFLGKDFVITIRTGRCKVITDLFEKYAAQHETAGKVFEQGSGYLLYMLISDLLQYISAMTDHVISELDTIEDMVFDNNNSDAQRIGKLRQKIVRLRRVIGPKRLLLQGLAEEANSFVGQSVSKYYSNNTKTANKLWEVIEEAKETVEIYKDADFTTSTEQTNEVLAVLTILFTFTIPITVFGTLYGMNVPLPGGLATGAWTFLGPYTTFEVLIAASFALALAMYMYFRGKHWF